MLLSRFAIIPTTIIISLLPGCANQSKEQIGTNIGVILGGLAGAAIGGKRGEDAKNAIILVSAIGGGLIGREIGKKLDAKDREKVSRAAQAALDTREVQTWFSEESGNKGRAEVVASSKDKQTGQLCRKVKNTVVLADGTEIDDDLTACKNSKGQWVTSAA